MTKNHDASRYFVDLQNYPDMHCLQSLHLQCPRTNTDESRRNHMQRTTVRCNYSRCDGVEDDHVRGLACASADNKNDGVKRKHLQPFGASYQAFASKSLGPFIGWTPPLVTK